MFDNAPDSKEGAARTRSTVDLLAFENVRDNGIVETQTSYAMLIEVAPREWLTLSEQRRSNLYVAYLTYLRGLSFPTQVFTVTTAFDAEQYYDQFFATTPHDDPEIEKETSPEADAVEEAAADGGVTAGHTVDDAPLLEYGRYAHVEWLDSILTLGEVRDRRFFVAVGVTKGEQTPSRDGWFEAIRSAFPGTKQHPEIEDEDPYLDEVWTRAHRVASQLPRTEVGTTVLTSRSSVLELLYLHYRGHESPISFDHSVFTTADERTLTDPATGEPVDLDGAFEEADQQERVSDPPEESLVRPTPEREPFDGRVAPEYVDTVTDSRLLRWYARNVAPIGSGSQAATPTSVYAGTSLFILAILFGAGAFLAFSASGTPQAVSSLPFESVVLREVSFILAASATPVFILSLVVLLPSSLFVRTMGVLGTAVTGGAIYLFQEAYPTGWDVSDMARTTTVLEVYGGGLFVLIIAVALSVRNRRAALSQRQTSPESTVPDGGQPDPDHATSRPAHQHPEEKEADHHGP